MFVVSKLSALCVSFYEAERSNQVHKCFMLRIYGEIECVVLITIRIVHRFLQKLFTEFLTACVFTNFEET